jgi:hypothetical protein
MAVVGMHLQEPGYSHCHLQAAGTPGVGWSQATGSDNCRCPRQEVLADMVAV